MKVISVFGVLAAAAVFMASCVSQPFNLGVHNPDGFAEGELVTLYVDQFVEVSYMNDSRVDWSKKKGGRRVVQVPSGVHTFSVAFDNGTVYTPLSMRVTGLFEGGNSYLLKHKVHRVRNGLTIGVKVTYHIFLYNDGKEGKEVTVDFAGIRGGDSSVLSRYIQYVLNPKMKEVGNSVRLENERYILVYEPELAYSLTDKETGIISEGRAGFTANIFLTEGRVFLLEADLSVLSIDAFLASNYAEDAQVVLVPVECSAGEVTYAYERPLELQGDRITFSITEIQKQ